VDQSGLRRRRLQKIVHFVECIDGKTGPPLTRRIDDVHRKAVRHEEIRPAFPTVSSEKDPLRPDFVRFESRYQSSVLTSTEARNAETIQKLTGGLQALWDFDD
jgi:hypothetical protein